MTSRRITFVGLISLIAALLVLGASDFASGEAAVATHPGSAVDIAFRVTGHQPSSLEDSPSDAQLLGARGGRPLMDPTTREEFVFDSEESYLRAYFNSSPINASGYAASADGVVTESSAMADAQRVFDAVFAGHNVIQGQMKSEVKKHLVQVAVEGPKARPEAYEYDIAFFEYVGEVKGPNFMTLTYDAQTGNLLSMVQNIEKIDVGLQPIVSRDEAIEIARKLVRMPISEVDSAQLQVWANPNDVQRLRWNVRLHTGDSELGAQGFVQIDATSGQVLDSYAQ